MKRKSPFFTKAVFWLGLLIIIYMFAILASETGKNYKLRSRTQELESQIMRLQAEIEELGYKITYYKTDSYKEKLAREKLNVQSPGESTVIIKDDKKGEHQDQPKEIVLKTDEQIEAEKPNYQQWWDFLFGN